MSAEPDQRRRADPADLPAHALPAGLTSGHDRIREIRGVRHTLALMVGALRLVWRSGRREFLVVVLLQVLQAAGVFVVLIQLQKAFTGLLTKNNGGSAPGLAINLVLFVLANVLIGLAGAIVTNRRRIMGERVSVYVCAEILRVTSYAELDDFDDSAFHDRLQRAAVNASGRPMQMVQALISLSQDVFSLISIWAALFFVQPLVSLTLMLVVVPIWIGGTRAGAQYFAFTTRIVAGDRGRGYLFNLLIARDPAKEIRAFGIAGHLMTRWRVSAAGRVDQLSATLGRQLRASMIASVGSNVVLALAAAGLIVLNSTGVLTLAQTATVAGALLLFSQRLLSAVSQTNDFFESAPLVNDLNDFLALEPSLVKKRGGVEYRGSFDRVDVEDVSFTYRDQGREALGGVSLSLRAGEVVALVGENGSGKTTLAKLIAGLYPPRAGTIRVDGVDLNDLDMTAWRRGVAVLFQDYLRYALPATDNIHLGCIDRDPDLDELRRAARASGADGFLAALPDGYDTILSPQFGKGLDLSLGQWQRVALARAFFRDAPLVILDEPSASLDARAERALFESVRELYRGKTVLLISHRFATVRTADRIVVLEQGRIVEQGNHAELMARDGLYAELFAMQASAFLDDDVDQTDDIEEPGPGRPVVPIPSPKVERT